MKDASVYTYHLGRWRDLYGGGWAMHSKGRGLEKKERGRAKKIGHR